MRAGKLRDLIHIQTAVTAQNDFGENEVTDWQDVVVAWAEVVDSSGREFVEARQENAQTFTRIHLRFNNKIHPKMRVKHGDRFYEIEAVLRTTNKNDRMQLVCSEVWPA